MQLAIAGARLVSSDPKFAYRISRFDRPLAPGATTRLIWKSQVWRRGFRAGSPATDIIENGTFSNNFDFAPIIGMDRKGILTDRAARRPQQLPPVLRPAKLADLRPPAR